MTSLIRTALIVMGALIVAGFVFLGYVSYQRMTGVGYFAKPHVEPAPTELAALGLIASVTDGKPVATALHLGNDAQVVAVYDFGNRALLLIRQPKIGDRLYLVDPRTGGVLSAIGIGDSVPPLPGAGVAPPLAASVPAPAPAPAAPAAKPPAAAPAPNTPGVKPAVH